VPEEYTYLGELGQLAAEVSSGEREAFLGAWQIAALLHENSSFFRRLDSLTYRHQFGFAAEHPAVEREIREIAQAISERCRQGDPDGSLRPSWQ